MPEDTASSLRPVVVLSRNYSTALGVIRSLGAAGYPVDLVASANKPGASQISACSKYVDNAVEIVAKSIKTVYDLELMKEMLEYEGRYPQKPVLFPIDDYTASIADRHREELSGIFEMPRIVGDEGDGSMLARMDKSFQARLAAESGLKTPLEWVIPLQTSIEIPDDMVYPCFCKPIESISGYKKEMARCDSREDLTTQLELMRKNSPHRSVLVQEFLEIEREIDFSGVCNDQNVVVPGIIKKSHIAQHEIGVTMAGSVIPADELGETLEAVKRFLQSLHYVGMFDMELNLVGGEYYFNEVNLRSGGPSFSYFMSGVNLPALAVEAILGQAWDEEKTRVTEFGKKFVYEKVAWEDFSYGFLTRGELRSILAEADFGLLINKDDPEPGKVFMRQMRTKDLKKRLKGTRDQMRAAERSLEQKVFRYPQGKKDAAGDSDASKPRAMVIGESSANMLAAIDALGTAGYDVEVLRIKKKGDALIRRIPALAPEGASPYVTHYHLLFAPKGFKAIVERLTELADPQCKMILIPADARSANAINAYHDELGEHYALPCLDKRLCGLSANRDAGFIMDTAQQTGVPLRSQFSFSVRGGAYDLPAGIEFPCSVRICPVPATTRTYSMTCQVPADLEIALRKNIRLFDFDVHIRCIPEQIATYYLPGIAAEGKPYAPAYLKRVDIESAGEKGPSETNRPDDSDEQDAQDDVQEASWELVNANELGETTEALTRFVEGLGFSGPYTIKMVEKPDGSMVFSYIRFYLYPLSEMLLPQGVNLHAAFADYLTTGKLPENDVESAFERAPAEKPEHDAAVKFAENAHAAGKTLRTARRDSRDSAAQAMLTAQRYARAYPQTLGRNRRNPNAQKPRVVVAGRNFCSNLCMAKALGLAGYEVEILRLFQVVPGKGNLIQRLTPEAYSKHVKSFDTFVSHRSNRAIVQRLKEMADPSYKKLVFPADDLSAAIVDEYYDELSEFFIMPSIGGRAGGIMELMSKAKQKELARAAGLPVANGVKIPLIEGAFTIPESVTYPCFTKPDISRNASKKRMMVCNSREELHNALSRFAKYGNSVMFVEDCLDIAREHSILGVSAGGKTISPAFFSALVGGQNARCGVAILGQIQDGAQYRELIEKCTRFVESLDYTGLWDIDLIETTSGEIIFAEINLRFGASGFAFTKTGLNLPGMLADFWTFGTPIDEEAATSPEAIGKTFLSEKVLIEEYASGRISLEEYNEMFESPDIRFVCDEDDPKPGEFFKRRAIPMGRAERVKNASKPARDNAKKALRRVKRMLG